MFATWLWMWACSTPLEVTAVDPATVTAGETLTVRGAGFDAYTAFSLVPNDDPAAGATPEAAAIARAKGESWDVQLTDVAVADGASVTGRVPRTARPGRYGVRAAAAGGLHLLPDAVEIRPAPEGPPCEVPYRSSASVSNAREMVIIQRFYKDDTQEQLRVPFRDVNRVLWERTPSGTAPDGTPAHCDAVWLERFDGSRILLEDAPRGDLQRRAKKVAEELGREVAGLPAE